MVKRCTIKVDDSDNDKVDRENVIGSQRKDPKPTDYSNTQISERSKPDLTVHIHDRQGQFFVCR
jgi:hypothetical protein